MERNASSGTWEHGSLKRPFIHVAITALPFPAVRPHCLTEETESISSAHVCQSSGKRTCGWTGGNSLAGLTSQAIHNSHNRL